MHFKKIRKSLRLTQQEFGILLGTSVGNVRNWEQGQRFPDNTTLTLYKLIERKEQMVLVELISIACEQYYADLRDLRALQNMVHKLIESKLLAAVLEMTILEKHKERNPEELGLRVTSIIRGSAT